MFVKIKNKHFTFKVLLYIFLTFIYRFYLFIVYFNTILNSYSVPIYFFYPN